MLTKKNAAQQTEDPIVEKPLNKFLFIESGNPGNEYVNYFTNGLTTGSFDEARSVLRELQGNHLPELVIINIPLNFLEMVAFRKWIRAAFSTQIPVVYNETALSTDETRLLFGQQLVDDVINLDSNYRMLPYKAKFIKKVSGILFNQSEKEPVRDMDAYCKFCFIKRSIDLLLSGIAIIFCLPLLLLIAIAIRLESKGPIIYSAKRAGKGFKVFKFYKFRTMVVDADKKINELASRNLYGSTGEKPAFFKLEHDPRVTKVGSFLRNTSLDELPQLLNVLKGDMSIVGNRPLPLYEAASLTTNEWAERFMAPAGITGLWQVKKRGQKDMSAEERLALDINYARNNNIARDLWIMAKTPSALLQKTNV